jgi:hypothetical protein
MHEAFLCLISARLAEAHFLNSPLLGYSLTVDHFPFSIMQHHAGFVHAAIITFSSTIQTALLS